MDLTLNIKALRADLLLLLIAAIWGFAFAAQIKGMDHMGPFFFNACRFALGFLSLLPVYFYLEKNNRRKNNSKTYDRRLLAIWGIPTGIILFFASSLQQIGLLYTTAGNSGFITGFYIILVPVLGIALGHATRINTWVGGTVALAGLYFLTVKDGLSFNKGDLITLACALMYAIQILMIGVLSRRVHPLQLSLQQFLVSAVLSFIVALIFEVVSLDAIMKSLIPLLYTGVMSTSVAFTLQVVAQRDAPSSHAAIIMSLEAVFAVIGGWLILDEQLGDKGLAGCALMMVGMLLSQLKRSKSARSAAPDTV